MDYVAFILFAGESLPLGARKELDVTHHAHQAIGSGGREVISEPHFVDKVEVGGRNIGGLLPAQYFE